MLYQSLLQCNTNSLSIVLLLHLSLPTQTLRLAKDTVNVLLNTLSLINALYPINASLSTFPNPFHTVKAPTQRLFTPYFRVTISILCIFCDKCTQIISLEFCLLIKVIILWCVYHLVGPRWHSESSNKTSF